MAPLIPGPHSQCFLVHLQNRLFLGDVVLVPLLEHQQPESCAADEWAKSALSRNC